ncbi:MAG TPA: serine hydroxymethyltransferase [Bacteroidetes bacterium]|nr:serine hydroxymethyltransferase [Bacteroidota bacterium]HDZ12880.1 serine hydroxymethyltransferase [Bacteroidota bacterium]
MEPLRKVDPEIFQAIVNEIHRQNDKLELIASENFVSEAVLRAMGSVMTNKYAEGYPGKRYYGGCEFVDVAENLARARAMQLFGAVHANVQPHSGTQANMAVYFSLLKPGDTFMGMNLAHGGHLSHGSPVNFSGRYYRVVAYGVDESGFIDMNRAEEIARKEKPKMIMTGASAYSREIDFKAFREIADRVGAKLVADIAHPAGLIAAGLVQSPIPYAHVITTTTHKTLRGPRGGMILLGVNGENDLGITTPKGRVKLWSEVIDSNIFPGSQGGPLMHVIAAKAVAFKEDLQPSFRQYARQIIANAKAMSDAFLERDYRVVSGGTDTHLMLLDLSDRSITGKEAEKALERAGMTVNKNMVPFDKQSPFVTSGIRVGTPALTTRGMKEDEMRFIVGLMDKVLRNPGDETVCREVLGEVQALCKKFPLYQVPE